MLLVVRLCVRRSGGHVLGVAFVRLALVRVCGCTCGISCAWAFACAFACGKVCVCACAFARVRVRECVGEVNPAGTRHPKRLSISIKVASHVGCLESVLEHLGNPEGYTQ